MSLDVYLERDNCGCCQYHANITHNLNEMAQVLGVYGAVWRPEENGIELASQLIEPLTRAIGKLESNPTRYKRYNPSNGFGGVESLLAFLRDYLLACQANPGSRVRACR